MTRDELEKMPKYSNAYSDTIKKSRDAVVYELPFRGDNTDLPEYWKDLSITCAYGRTYNHIYGLGLSVYNLTKKHIEALPSLTKFYAKTARQKNENMNMVVIKTKSDLADFFTMKSLSEGSYKCLERAFAYPIGPGYWNKSEKIIHKSHVADMGYICRRIGIEGIEKEIYANSFENLKVAEEKLKRHENLPVMRLGEFIKSRLFGGRDISFYQKSQIKFLMNEAGMDEYCFNDFIIVPEKFPLKRNFAFCREGRLRGIMDLRRFIGMEFDFEMI